jgi:hypothetical protein
VSAPASLKPFVRALEPFEPQIATALSKWLPRLALLVGPIAKSVDDGGDPDGYDGVARRGPYDRLLLSEWATALELPDEFVRRAAMNEHLFVELSRRQPQGSLRSLVLVDPGPDQLGAPRLVHLAAAIVAEARAARAKAAFAWGTVSDASTTRVFPSVGVDSVRHVLDARRATPLPPSALDRWFAAVERFEGDVDVIFVGGAHLERVVRESPFAKLRARTLRVDSVFAGGALDVAVASSEPSPRPLRLPLPDDALCVRALRDPFEREKSGSPVPELDVVAAAGLAIPLAGRRILVRTKDGVAALFEPNSPRASLGPPRHLRLERDDVLLAACLVGRRPLALVRVRNDKLNVVFAGNRVTVDGVVAPTLRVLSNGKPVATNPDDGVRLLVPMGSDAPVDDGRTPVPIPELDGRPRGFMNDGLGYALLPFLRRVAELKPDHLIAPIAHRGDVLSVRVDGAHVAVSATSSWTPSSELPPAPLRIATTGVTRAFFGALRTNSEVPGALAFTSVDGRWTLVHGREHFSLPAPDGEVVGCVAHPAHGACVAVVEDERRLAFIGKSAVERHAFAAPIAGFAPNLELPQVAVMTTDGAVTVLFLKTGVRSVVCRGVTR